MNFSSVTKVLLRFFELDFPELCCGDMIFHVLKVGCSPRRLVGRMICVAGCMIWVAAGGLSLSCVGCR